MPSDQLNELMKTIRAEQPLTDEFLSLVAAYSSDGVDIADEYIQRIIAELLAARLQLHAADLACVHHVRILDGERAILKAARERIAELEAERELMLAGEEFNLESDAERRGRRDE